MRMLPDSFYHWLSDLSEIEGLLFLLVIILIILLLVIIGNKIDKD